MSTPDTALAPAPAPRRRLWVRLVRWALLLGLASVLFVCVVGYWLVGTQGGAEYAFGKVQELIGKATKIEGIEGTIGGTLKIRMFEIVRPGLVVRIEGLEADISPVYFSRLVVHRLHARSVEVRTAPAQQPSPRAKAPPRFAPPFPVLLEDGAVGTFTYGGLAPGDKDLVLTQVRLRGEGGGVRWKVADGAAGTPWGKVTLSGTVAGDAPFDLDAAAAFEGTLQQESVRAKATAKGTLQEFEAKVEAATAGARAAASTKIQPFAAAPLGSIAVEASGVDLSRFAPSMPSTRITAHAKMALQGETLSGPIGISNGEPGAWDAHRLPVVSASTELALSPRGADLSKLDLELPAGGVRGTAHVGGDGAQAHLELTGVDLATLHGKLRKTQLAGTLSITGDRDAQHFEAAVEDPRFGLEAKASLAARRLEVQSAHIRAAGGSVSAKASVALEGKRDFHVEGEARNFDPSAFTTTRKGDLNFTFSTTGTWGDATAGEAKVDITASTYAGLAVTGHARVAGDPQRIAAADIDVALSDAHLTARGSLGRAGDAMDLALRVPDLAKVSRPFGKVIAGNVEAKAKVAGTFDDYTINASVNGTNLLLPGDFRMDGFKLALDGTRPSHRLDATATMNSRTALHVVLQGGLVPRQDMPGYSGRIETLVLTGPGAFSLVSPATLAVSTDSVELGDATLHGDWGDAHFETTRWVRGTFDFKGSAPTIEIRRLARSLQLEAPPSSDLVFSANWNLHGADNIDGNITVKRESGDIRVGDPELAMGLREAMLAIDATQGKLHATLGIDGQRSGTLRGEAHGELVRAGSIWEFAKSAPVDAHVVAAVPNLDVLAPWFGPDTKMGGRLDADVTVTGTGAQPRMDAKARVQDLMLHEPRTGFEIAKGNASLHVDGNRLVIDELSARTPWHVPDRARPYVTVQAPADGGSISASGSVDFSAHTGSIRVKFDKVPVTQLETRFVAASGEASVEADGKGSSVTGNFKVDGGWVGALAQAPPSPSDDIVVIRTAQPPAESKSKEPIRIDVSASLGSGIAFQGRGLDTRLVGDLHVVGDVGTPLRATGSIRTSQGTYEGYGQKLTIDRGVLIFAGPIDNPKLNVLATRKGLQVEPGVEVTGTVARPRVRLVSTPDVPESEKLSWLVLGRSAAGTSGTDIGMLSAAAGALMGENRPGADLQKTLGIDEVSIGHSDSGSPLGVMPQSTVAGRTGAPAATDVVTIGSQITKDVRMSYEQGFADAEGALKFTWSITRQFQLLARAGYLPGLDVVYRWTIK
jgi:translocation and assembly module TamB